MKKTVLFLCATNGVQSPMAEALLRRIDSEHFEVVSAGIEPATVHPCAIEAMNEVGVNLALHRPISVQDLPSRNFNFVVTLSNRAQEACPEFPSADLIHWHFEDPLTLADPERQKRAFRALRDQIAQRLHLFVLVQVRKKVFSALGQRDRTDRIRSSA